MKNLNLPFSTNKVLSGYFKFLNYSNEGKKLVITLNKIIHFKKDWRRIAKRQFDEKTYHQRSKVETIFSSIKRKYGSNLRARDFFSQKKEILCKLIAYNIDRITKNIFYLLRVSANHINVR